MQLGNYWAKNRETAPFSSYAAAQSLSKHRGFKFRGFYRFLNLLLKCALPDT